MPWWGWIILYFGIGYLFTELVNWTTKLSNDLRQRKAPMTNMMFVICFFFWPAGIFVWGSGFMMGWKDFLQRIKDRELR